jgi:hypothetical protein
MKPLRSTMLCAVLVAALAACGGDVADDQLPLNTGTEPSPSPAGACLVDEPDCNDTGVPADGDELPPPSDGDAVSGGIVADPLTVSQVLISDIGGVIAVQGFLFDDGSGPLLCETLAESFPPQCGGESLPVSGHEEAVDVPIVTEQGVTWTDQPLVLFGEYVDGTLVVDPTVLG